MSENPCNFCYKNRKNHPVGLDHIANLIRLGWGPNAEYSTIVFLEAN